MDIIGYLEKKLNLLVDHIQYTAAQGLESEVAVELNTEGMSAQLLYVAMTRGTMKLVVCSASPLLG